MSLRIENTLVAKGQRLINRIVTLRSQSVIPAYAFRRTVAPVKATDANRAKGSWAGLGTMIDSEEHAIDYEPLGHAMVLIVDSIAGALHDGGSFVLPEELNAVALVEPYDILLEGDERLKMQPDWTLQKTDLLCLLLNGHKEFHEVTGISGQSMLAAQGVRYSITQRFDLGYIDALKEDNVQDVAVPYK